MSSEEKTHGAAVVITHRVRKDRHADYEKWLEEIVPVSTSAPGHLDWQIVRPVRGLTETFTVLIRFDGEAHLRAWMESDARRHLIERVQPLLVGGDDFFVGSGLDFWFAPAGARVPVRWKQCLVTWSAIYPLAFGLPFLVAPALRAVGVPAVPPLVSLVVTGIAVVLMVYVVMPRYTKLVRRWLFS